MMTRRVFLKATVAAVPAATAPEALAAPAAEKRPRCILLRSSWQTVNIGDIGHTPGAVRLLETYLPDAEIILWPSSVDNGVGTMLQKAFPRLRIAEGRLERDGRPSGKALQEAWERADLLLHGSGPSVVARDHVAAWHRIT
jgi:hypothetical protein